MAGRAGSGLLAVELLHGSRCLPQMQAARQRHAALASLCCRWHTWQECCHQPSADGAPGWATAAVGHLIEAAAKSTSNGDGTSFSSRLLHGRPTRVASHSTNSSTLSTGLERHQREHVGRHEGANRCRGMQGAGRQEQRWALPAVNLHHGTARRARG